MTLFQQFDSAEAPNEDASRAADGREHPSPSRNALRRETEKSEMQRRNPESRVDGAETGGEILKIELGIL